MIPKIETRVVERGYNNKKTILIINNNFNWLIRYFSLPIKTFVRNLTLL